MTKKSLVRVQILGEEYSLRTDASAEHTRAVAEYLDRAVRSVVNAGMVVETQKAAILAALQITSELFEARADADGARAAAEGARAEAGEAQAEVDAVAASLRALSDDVRRLLPPAKRGSMTTPV